MMKSRDHLQTIAVTYQEICRGEAPWVALGNFLNDWFDYAKDKRAQLVTEPVVLPPTPSVENKRWAAFCAASVEWLCSRYGVSCPSWTQNPAYTLPDPWFDSPGAHKPQVRARLIEQTPEPFKTRNIYCGNRMFLNKYELAGQAHRRSA